jgi:C4-dicarboxylate-specific signal transduction histidine kinase
VYFCWFRCFSGVFDIQHRLSAWRPQRSAGSGRCDTALWLIKREENDFVVVEVADEGPGIPSDVQARMFEPFYTTKEIDTGTGLGLDIVHRIVKGHNGTIEAGLSQGTHALSCGCH